MEFDYYQTRSPQEWCKIIAEDRSITLSSYLESKGIGLFGNDSNESEKILNEIVDVVQLLPSEFLSTEQAGFLLNFFIRTLDRSALIGGSSINAIHHLLYTVKQIPDEVHDELFQYMFREGNVQEWNQAQRLKQFEILEWLLYNRLGYLQQINDVFLESFLKAIGGEREPNCLLKVFNLFEFVVANFQIASVYEDLFESIACYFPVQYKEVPNIKLTRKLLAAKCASCLVAHPKFSVLCFMLISEKLTEEDVTDDEVEDSLQLLILASQNFDPKSICYQLKELLAGIRMTAINPKNRKAVPKVLLNAVESMIGMIRRLPEKESQSIESQMERALIENLEPFVLQAEMGLTQNALELLKISFKSLSPKIGKEMLQHIIAWLSSLVQGDTVNTAANKEEVVSESLEFMKQWIEIAIRSHEEGIVCLKSFESTIFASLLVAREYAPSKSLIAFYKCAKEYLDFSIASPLLIEQCRSLMASGLSTVIIEAECEPYCKMITSLSSNNFPEVERVINDNSTDKWNQSKIIPVLCAITVDEKSYNLVREQLKQQLEKQIENIDAISMKEFTEMVKRCEQEEELCWTQVELFDSILMNNLTQSNIDEMVQEMVSVLNESRRIEYLKRVSQRYYDHKDNVQSIDRIFGLAMLLSNDEKEIKNLLDIGLPDEIARKFLFAAINRGFVIPDGLKTDNWKNIWESFVCVKAHLLSDSSVGIRMFSELVQKLTKGEYELNGQLEECYKYLFDFKSNEFDPTKCGYKISSIFWKQKLFFMIVPEFKRIFETVEMANKEKLFSMVPPLLEFAKMIDSSQVQDQYATLFPLLLSSFINSDNLNVTLVESIPLFLSSSQLPADCNVKEFTEKLCLFLRKSDSNMKTVIHCLDALLMLIHRHPANKLQPLIGQVSKSCDKLLGHRKRIVRQKSASVKNNWELLTTK